MAVVEDALIDFQPASPKSQLSTVLSGDWVYFISDHMF
jgi:hypothetical protein